ncbi:MAG: flagellar M-ring protein FliF, partial [Deltaproteobacteria bacterium]|nr:flagellar M-ring protein FliF [Deltaproteobacteria bacterium]
MDPLVKSLKELPARFAQLPKMLLVLFGLVLAAAIAGSVVFANAGQDHWQYAFTNLTADDASEIAATLKTANVPFRMEAGGQALAVPAEKVYDARLLLAAAGLPRGGGAGFELFDRGDLGISEFTQKVNLRRALEGELARTIGHLSNVRSARVHLTLAEKGLYRTEDQKAGAAVVVQLQPGRSLDEREVSGIRHLVASAVPGLDAEAVTLVDGRGTALSTESLWGEAEAFRQREMEKSLESRLVTLLEPAVGQGAVVARVSVTLDNTEVQTNKEVVDPQVVLRSEHKMTQSANADSQQGAIQSGLVGAAANTPYVNTNAAGQNVNGSKSNNSSQDESKNYEI